MKRGLAGAWVLVAATACTRPHVNLSLPPNLPPEQRVATYNQLRGAYEETEIVTSCGRNGCSSSEHRSVRLANGTQVHHPEDLLPLVQPGSATARHVQARDSAAHRGRMAGLVAAAAILAGTGLMFSSAGSDDGMGFREKLGIGIIVLGGLGGGGAVYYFRGRELEATSRAYDSFSADLAERLQVCVNGLMVAPCEALGPAPALPAAPAGPAPSAAAPAAPAAPEASPPSGPSTVEPAAPVPSPSGENL